MAAQLSEADFVRLFTTHEVRLRAFALSLIPHWADAEEVLQEANVVIWQKFREFRPGSSFFSWAAKIVHLTAKDFRKRQARERLHFNDRFFDAVAIEMAEASGELAERERLLGECVAKLQQRARQILQLRYEQGRSVQEAAATMGTSAGAIYDAMGRIFKALSKCIQRGLAHEGMA